MFHTPQAQEQPHQAHQGQAEALPPLLLPEDQTMRLVHGSNDDRRWFAEKHKAARLLALKAAGMAQSEETTSAEAMNLLREVQKAQEENSRQWKSMHDRYVAANRTEALQEAIPMWQRIDGLLTGAINNAKEKTPNMDPLGVSDMVASLPLPRRTPTRQIDDTRVIDAPYLGAAAQDMQTDGAVEAGGDGQEALLRVLVQMQEEAAAQQQRMEDLERCRGEESREMRRQLQEIRSLYKPSQDEDSFRGENAATKTKHTYAQSTPLPTAGKLTVSSIDEMCPGGVYNAESSKNANTGATRKTPGGARTTTSTGAREKGTQQSRLKAQQPAQEKTQQGASQSEKGRVYFEDERADGATGGGPATTQTSAQAFPAGETRNVGQKQEMHPIVAKYARQIPNYSQRNVINPYVTISGQATPEWYETELNRPLNVRPVVNDEPFTDLRKLEPHCPKFSGKDADYPASICSYLPNIHRANAPVGLKAQCLYKCFNKDDPRLQEMIKRLGNTKEGYARVLHRLTRTYGHPEGILASRLQAIEEIKTVTSTNLLTMEKWLMRLEDYCDTAVQLGRAEDLMSQKSYNENVVKLDDEQALLYREWVKWNAPRRDLPSLVAWLDERVQNLRDLERQKAQQKSSQESQRVMTTTVEGPKRSRLENTKKEEQLTRQSAGTCPMDGEKHPLFRCEAFKQLKPDDRRDLLDDWKRCYSCLMSGHQMSTCKKGITCLECKKNHHTMLHGSRMGRPRRTKSRIFFSNPEEWSEDSEEEEDEIIMKSTTSTGKVSLQTLPITLYNPRNRKNTDLNLLIDPGCAGAFLSTRAARELELEGEIGETTITGFGGLKKKTKIAIATVQISAKGRKKRHWMQVRITEDPASSYWPHNWSRQAKQYTHLEDLKIAAPVPNRPVDIMIGMSNPELISSMEKD